MIFKLKIFYKKKIMISVYQTVIKRFTNEIICYFLIIFEILVRILVNLYLNYITLY